MPPDKPPSNNLQPSTESLSNKVTNLPGSRIARFKGIKLWDFIPLWIVVAVILLTTGVAFGYASMHNHKPPHTVGSKPLSDQSSAATVKQPPKTSTTAGSSASTTKSSSTTPNKSTTASSVSSNSSVARAGSSIVPAGSNCTNPSWSSSDPEDTESIGSDDVWWVNNDAWSGSHGPQSIYVCSQTSWYAVSTQPNVGGQVETYPDSEYDINSRGNATKTIAQLTSITSTFSEAYPSAGTWDAAYDLWTNDWTNETMIWNQWAGAQSYWPSQATIALTLNGVPYHFYNNGGELMFFRDSQVTSGSVDILAAFQWEVAHGYASSTDKPTQLEYGVEICSTSGAETFPMTGLTFAVN